MKMIRALMEVNDEYTNLPEELEKLAETFNELMDELDPLMENVAPMEIDPMLTVDLEDAMKRFEAAKRGLSIVSRFKPGPERKKHASRVMTNMNKIRGLIRRVQKKLIDSFNDKPTGLMSAEPGSEIAQ